MFWEDKWVENGAQKSSTQGSLIYLHLNWQVSLRLGFGSTISNIGSWNGEDFYLSGK